jgi:hypothetical protein
MALPLLAALGPALGVGAGVAGVVRGSDKSTIRGLEEARLAAQGMEVPEEEMLRYNLEMLRNMGQLTPEMEQEILQESSGMNHISTDPALRDAQMEALTRMERRGKEGLTLEERAAAEDINRGIQQEGRAANDAVLQNMQARGQLGSGGELAARLSAGQAGMDSARQQGTELARLMAARKLEATMNAGQMGGQIREQDFGEQAQKAKAQDMINQFNTSARQGVQQRNVGSKNDANQYNLDYSKDLEANRVDTTNNQKVVNRDAYTTAMDARNAKRGTVANIGMSIGQAKDRQFANRISGIQKIGSSISSMPGVGGVPAGAAPVDAAGGTTQYSKDYLKS